MNHFFTNYRFYPFFLECSMKETDMIKKRHLELLAFGRVGVFRESVYVTENGNFKIPKIFSDEERDKLYKLLWDGDETLLIIIYILFFSHGKKD